MTLHRLPRSARVRAIQSLQATGPSAVIAASSSPTSSSLPSTTSTTRTRGIIGLDEAIYIPVHHTEDRDAQVGTDVTAYRRGIVADGKDPAGIRVISR